MSQAAQPARVERYDLAGRLSRFERTPSGGLRIPAYISRTGVQVYRDASGQVVREYRPPAEVLAEASWRSFEGAPVTRLHPEELVNPLTWREHVIGIVRNVRPDGDRVAADLMIEDATAIAEIEAGDLIETSAGYTAEVTDGAGEADGEAYDATQSTIRGNHVALGPADWGRAGPSVRLRIDAAHQVIETRPPRTARQDSMTTKRMVKIDGYEFEAGSESHLQAVDRLVSKLENERNEAKKRADAAEGKLSVVEKELETAKKRADELGSQEEMDSRVAKRLSLIDQARGLLGAKYKWAGKSDRQIMSDALKKAGHAVSDDASADFVAGAFAHAVAAAKSAKDAKREKDADEEPDEDELLDAEGDEEELEDEGEAEELEDADEDDEGEREDGGRRDSRGFRVTRVRRSRQDAADRAPVRPPFEEKWRR